MEKRENGIWGLKTGKWDGIWGYFPVFPSTSVFFKPVLLVPVIVVRLLHSFEVAFEIKDVLRKIKARIQNQDNGSGVLDHGKPSTGGGAGPMWKQQ
jgi:hypothetical protein